MVAALIGFGGSVLVAAVALIATRWTNSNATKAAEVARRTEAYGALLGEASLVIYHGRNLRVPIGAETGIKSSPLLRGAKAPSTVELLTYLQRHVDGLSRAASTVLLVGSPGVQPQVNEIVSFTATLMEIGVTEGRARGAVATQIVGQEWTPQQEHELDTALQHLANLRGDFYHMARAELERGLRHEQRSSRGLPPAFNEEPQ